ncbi:MAG TPA: M81 family metallopeptidase [Isosphaeraceae bacterium]|jgi:microcystin degradation protein MlrC|nr:M81 family metallopeptidase [Isosphaeraceae bacterium]
MVRVAIGGLMHESNTFAGSVTDLAAFEAGGLETGVGIVARWGRAHHEVGGFLEAAGRLGFEAVPTLMAWATPAGPVTAEAFHTLVDRLVHEIDVAGPVDAVLLALHGAMVAEGELDADGLILTRVREKIGSGRRLVATLDYHGNVSPVMVAATDAIVAYQTYPHVDQRHRGFLAAGIATLAVRREIEPMQALSKPPLLIPLLAQETDREPMRSVMAEAEALEPRNEVLAASVLAGFPYADVPAAGPSCVVVTDADWDLASQLAEGLASRLWDLRHRLAAALPAPGRAVAMALSATKTPVVLVDLGDNVGGGSAADSTVLIQELLRQGATGTIVVLCDPGSVRACVSAGVGNEVRVAAGGKIDQNDSPVSLRGRVRLLHDGQYVEDQPRHGGLRQNDQGLTAVVALPGDNTVVLTSRRHPPFSLGQLTSLGLRPEQARVLVVKAAVAYKAAYGPIAGSIIEVDTPGLTAANPARFSYSHLRKPMFPIDPEP